MKLSALAYGTAIVFGQNPYCPANPTFPPLRFYTRQEQEENAERLRADTYRYLFGSATILGATNGPP